MSGGETARIAEIAERLSNEIFSFFKWKTLPSGLMNQNFNCLKKEEHVVLKDKQILSLRAEYEQILITAEKKGALEEELKQIKEKQDIILKELATKKKEELSKTHPVDAVFFYTDPYTKEKVYFNCDLKSYKQSSITATSIRSTLSSLSQTIHCARDSEEWNTRYNCQFSGEVRGLLFLLNHDGRYTSDLRELFKKKEDSEEQRVVVDNLKIQPNQVIHIIDPSTICYLDTIKKDIAYLTSCNKFPHPRSDWFFFYPDLKISRPIPDTSNSPATIEMMLGPFLIIKYKEFERNDGDSREKEGFLIYYKLPGASKEEFLFFLDTLSSYQIFKHNININIRMINNNPDPQSEENFNNAIMHYIENWQLNEEASRVFKKIDFSLVENISTRFLTKPILYREL
ncbi:MULTISPECIES: hypothetical protein [Acinetobacter calcoaceticus/baumannii complex]|nr:MULTISPECIES: hypothetical protein [Acinetobacter calcoaceticus/baumannii complex]EHU1447025.1 hypothetical protein [Acinetobacter baumannii]EHU2668543.1 hypothetical protein [Acinetobacter baumannii]EHU3279275.1 hypothetical protein [Acinetobacter baumannii]EIB6918899.1 hypothetical protein [Acinetobacter baumannii]EKV4358426.1 hypothetical protein [Acinetobacter baumannii]